MFLDEQSNETTAKWVIIVISTCYLCHLQHLWRLCHVIMISRPFLLTLTLLLAGCDLEALLADPKEVKKIADSKAIGSACRHGLRSIEDCYALNEKASKAAMFDGWKEMDQYMRDNKIDGIEPKGMKPPPPPEEEIISESKPKGKAKAAAH